MNGLLPVCSRWYGGGAVDALAAGDRSKRKNVTLEFAIMTSTIRRRNKGNGNNNIIIMPIIIHSRWSLKMKHSECLDKKQP